MLMQAPEGRRLIEPAPGRLLPNDAAKSIRALAGIASEFGTAERYAATKSLKELRAH
jgi:hypothetical protein